MRAHEGLHVSKDVSPAIPGQANIAALCRAANLLAKRGCDAQAWGATEFLRVSKLLAQKI
jgi:hypothetical protein